MRYGLKFDRVKKTAASAAQIGTVIIAIATVLIFGFSHEIMRMFTHVDEVIRL